ncbi:MAG TPA: PilT/PilU family type 4a pilus ATPase [Gammaproteobacteria bacterium]|nr:PilT/PilU family type 4a pilus ATPase [Gammaproteobacteria bacterium]
MELLSKLLKTMVAKDASDLFLCTGSPPALRIDGALHCCVGDPLAPGVTEQMAQLVMRPEHAQAFEQDPEISLGYTVPGIGRFRFNVFRQRGEISLVIRMVPLQVPDFETLGIPELLKDITLLKRGLVLVVGPSGAGKSTTLAAMIDHRNQNTISHIITVEDPIEYVLEAKKSVINQREIGVDTLSYHKALVNALRQSPDMLMIGEIREHEIMEDVLEFADTGHLCLATLHANSASQVFERIVHMFPQEKRELLRYSLSQNIKAVISQVLVPKKGGGRTVAVEMLVATSRVRDLIRRGDFTELADVMEKDTNTGMCTMDQSLYLLYAEGKISEETALAYAESRSNMRLQMRLSGVSPQSSVDTNVNS